ncbi:hypothetical protein CHLRE_16g666250v5 [Chlamydomonas reinhardtii]|uniref:Sugar phosphate transporter domain-containing protein n=1 Tax=Chlamydomonas reinhardtii TaxID=3055 RepID=A0A2K3CTV6_CHLRE|nr:uncharacterized protein CHLRE_16g666250v5 [Chlamydomonas reinhardtii]PNW71718.1 hypothetical protein CHLRE_16g666250v5 [Chlamydomonas reinhardtii]
MNSRLWLGLLVAVIYGAVAVAANFVNKYAVLVFPLPTAILLMQTVTAMVLLRVAAALGFTTVPRLGKIRVWMLLPLTICYAAHAVLVLYSLAFLSVPMYNTLKRLTPVIVLVMKGVMDQRMPDMATTLSVLLIVGGCLVAGAGDLSFDGNGYSLTALCALMQATYILLAERLGSGGSTSSSRSGSAHGPAHTARAHKQREVASAGGPGSDVDSAEAGGSHGHTQSHHHHHGAGFEEDGGSKGPLGPIELLYSICVIATVPLIVASLISGDAAAAPTLLKELHESMGYVGFMTWLVVTAVMEGLLTGMVILCTQLNSALTTSVVGVLKGVVSSVLGFFLLGGVKFHIVNVAGMAMNMAGGVWYSFAQVLKGKSAS